MRGHTLCLAVSLLAAGVLPAGAQSLSQRGFVEGQWSVFPQRLEGNDDSHHIVQGLFRQELSWRPLTWLTAVGEVEARADNANRVADGWALDWNNRDARRPRATIRRALLTFRRGGVQVDVGKQVIRWGKADILNPTDRFAPRDFLDVVDNEVLPVTAGRLVYERGANSLEVVVQPQFTPSRMPLLGQRWTPLHLPIPLPVVEMPTAIPKRASAGVRWNHTGPAIEFSISAYDGFQHVPRIDAYPMNSRQAWLLVRTYTGLRMVGADLVKPTRWVTIRAEIGYFASRDKKADDYSTFVVQAERQVGEWLFVAGYAGEVVRASRGPASLALERGLARTFLGKATYTIDTNRAFSLEGALRRSGSGAYVKGEFSQALGAHWRLSVRGTCLGGDESDFLGQYRRNSSAGLVARYSY